MADISVLAYLAGVIDSDGTIGVSRSTYAMRVRGDARQPVYSPRVAVKQVTPQAIDLLHESLGGHRYFAGPSASKGRQLHVWSIHSAAAGRALEPLLPYLRIKSAQAENAIEVCRINSSSRRHRFDVPDIVEGEPMVTTAEAARRLNKSYDVVLQALRKGSVPHVRTGHRQVLIPESYLPIWATRPANPGRNHKVTAELEARYQRAKELNRVGV